MAQTHSSLTDTDGIHLPKGFDAASNDTALIKNASSSLEYRALSSLGATGPQGPAGPPLASTSVADINDPSTELASVAGAAAGDLHVAYEINMSSTADEGTLYMWDTETLVANSPYIVAGSGGTWIAVGGKYTNSDINTNGNIVLTGVSTVDGRDVSVDGTKLDGIESGATADQTGAEIKTAYEGEANTNAFTDAEQTKLAGLTSADFNVQTTIEEEFPPNNEDSDELGTHGWRKTASGTGNVGVMIDGEANHPGIYQMGCGTAASARSTIYLGEPGNDLLVLGSGEIAFDCVIRCTGAIGNFERMMAGLAQRVTTNAEWADGVYFRILTGGTNWEIVAANSSTRTAVDTGIPYVSGNWFRLGFTVNSAGTSIQARVNGSDAGSAVTTNIPTAALSPTFLSGALAAGGGINSTLDADYMKVAISYSGNRND